LAVKGIIFDLDGTLVDTLADLTDSMNAALSRLGFPARSTDECRQMIGFGLRRFAEKALGDEHTGLTDALMSCMVDHYKDHCLLKTAPYPDMESVVKTLSEKGFRLAVMTNKNQAPSEQITRHFFGCAFDPIRGATGSRKVKPNPQTTLDILDGWGLEKHEAVFVGDSEIDVQTAANAGIRCVACQWGFRSRDQLLSAGAETIICRPEQLFKIVI